MKKLLLIALIAGAFYQGWHQRDVVKMSSGGMSAEALHTLAASVKPGEVLMYSTTECTYCAQARLWMSQNGFAFSECNMSERDICVREFQALGADGTPYLIVRGHHMKNGFDSEEFLELLQT